MEGPAVTQSFTSVTEGRHLEWAIPIPRPQTRAVSLRSCILGWAVQIPPTLTVLPLGAAGVRLLPRLLASTMGAERLRLYNRYSSTWVRSRLLAIPARATLVLPIPIPTESLLVPAVMFLVTTPLMLSLSPRSSPRQFLVSPPPRVRDIIR